MPEAEVTPVEAVNPTPAEEVQPATATPEAKTISEIIENASPEAKPETVPLSVFIETKKEVKELRKALKDLESKAEQGATRSEISSDLDSIAEEFNVDKTFLKKIEAAFDAKTEQKLKPFEEKARQAKIDEAFTKHFTEAMESMPEYKEVVNPNVIKKLSLDPENSQKTFQQLIEEVYSPAISGKRTIDSTKPGGGKEPQQLDFEKARKDPAYFNEVMADPKQKAEYNSRMLARGF